MRYLPLIVSISFFSINIRAQRTLKVGFNFSPDYCYRNLILVNNDPFFDNFKKSRDIDEIPKLSFTSGLNFLIEKNNTFSFEGGMQYSNKGYIKKARFTSNLDPDGSSETLIFYSYNYLDLPLRMIVNWGENRVKFTSSFGITPGININRNISYTENGKRIKQKLNNGYNNFKDFNLTPTVSIGIDVSFNDFFNLKIEPTLRYGVLNTTDNNIKEYLWNVGLNTTLYYTFKHY